MDCLSFSFSLSLSLTFSLSLSRFRAFSSFPRQAGAVALLQHAVSGGAISNARVRAVEWIEGDSVDISIPTLSVTYAVGTALRIAADTDTVSLSINATISYENTYNVLCDVGNFDAATDVVVLGAHLGEMASLGLASAEKAASLPSVVRGCHTHDPPTADSVPEGPGMNDNGSVCGSARA